VTSWGGERGVYAYLCEKSGMSMAIGKSVSHHDTNKSTSIGKPHDKASCPQAHGREWIMQGESDL
jgi:hypothetical protein